MPMYAAKAALKAALLLLRSRFLLRNLLLISTFLCFSLLRRHFRHLLCFVLPRFPSSSFFLLFLLRILLCYDYL